MWVCKHDTGATQTSTFIFFHTHTHTPDTHTHTHTHMHMHCNALSSINRVIIMGGLLSMRDEEVALVRNFEHWHEPQFIISFCLAAGMGSILNYSIFLCTLYNSALTTTVVGCLKVS